MPDNLPLYTQHGLHGRADLAGATIGCLIVFLAEPLLAIPFGRRAMLSQMGMTLGLVVLAAFIVVGLMDWKRIPRDLVAAVGSSTGIRAGWVTAMVGGAVLCIYGLIRNSVADPASTELVQGLRMCVTSLVALAGILPAVSVGYVSGNLAARMMPHGTAEFVDAPPQQEIPQLRPLWQRRLSKGIVWGSIAGLASPLLGTVFDLNPRPAVLPPRQTHSVPLPVVREAPVPVWQYSPPEGWLETSPQDIFVSRKVQLPNCKQDVAPAISPDSNWLAFFPPGDTSVAFFDLRTATPGLKYELLGVPKSISWSPDSTRILVLSDHKKFGLVLEMLNSDKRNGIQIPVLDGAELPKGPIRWTAENEVEFHPDDESPLRLNLADLRLYPQSEPLHTSRVDSLGIAPSFPRTNSWRMEAGEFLVHTWIPTRRRPEDGSGYLHSPCLAIVHPVLPIRRVFPDIAMEVSDTILASPDGTKVIRIREEIAGLYYLGTEKMTGPQFTAKIPLEIEGKSPTPEQEKGTQISSFCVMVYPPIVNPLTQKIVGPDRERPKGILRIAKWTNDSAKLWASEIFHHLEPSDVMSDVHQWVDGKLVPEVVKGDELWWALLGEGEALEKGAVSEEISLLPLHWEPTYEGTSFTSRTIVKPAAKDIKTEKEDASNLSPSGEVFSLAEKDLKPAVESVESAKSEEVPQEAIVQKVKDFVIAHHAKSSEADLTGLEDDYDFSVDYLGSRKSRLEIIEEQRAYHQRWTSVKENIESEIKVTNAKPDYEARYTVDFLTSNNAGVWISGKNDLLLKLKIQNGRILITRQSGRVYNRKSNKPER